MRHFDARVGPFPPSAHRRVATPRRYDASLTATVRGGTHDDR